MFLLVNFEIKKAQCNNQSNVNNQSDFSLQAT